MKRFSRGSDCLRPRSAFHVGSTINRIEFHASRLCLVLIVLARKATMINNESFINESAFVHEHFKTFI